MKYLLHSICPDFAAPAVMPGHRADVSFRWSEFSADSYAVLFFYPLDFSQMALLELQALNARMSAFRKLGCRVAVVSCDSYLAHNAWQILDPAAGGLGSVLFPMISDITRNISRNFELLVADAVPESAVFVTDKSGKVVLQSRLTTSIGRNMDALLSAISRLQRTQSQQASPAAQILELERYADRLRQDGFYIVAQSVDKDLSDPEWQALPRFSDGRLKLSFHLVFDRHPWPEHDGLTLVVRESSAAHSTGILLPTGELLFEYHSDRRAPRDFGEIVRLAEAIRHHQATGEIVPWPPADPGII